MQKTNCWEVVGCGRQRGGARAAAEGVCAAAIDVTADGINGGINGGRICWAIAGTDCPGFGQHERHKNALCATCSFYHRVIDEEGLQEVQLSVPGQIGR